MPRKHPFIALLTDFGTRDHYVGTMKAVALTICPSAQFIDISHAVGAQDIREASYLVWASYKYLPHGTTTAVVVDPGVGTSRRIVVARTRHHTFVAPDNGVLDFMMWEERVRSQVVVKSERLVTNRIIGRNISTTFHGRDIIAPIAAHLANGIPLSRLGPVVPVVKKAPPFYSATDARVVPEILWIDRYGNIVTNIRAEARELMKGLKVGSETISRWVENYAAASSRSASLIVGSSGLIEIVMKNGNAASKLLHRKKRTLTLIPVQRRGTN